jgi:hypothetical protein
MGLPPSLVATVISTQNRTLAEIDDAAAASAQTEMRRQADADRYELAKARRERLKREESFVMPAPNALPWVSLAQLMSRRGR